MDTGPASITSSFTLASSGQVGMVCFAPKAGNISKIGFFIAGHTVAATLDCRLETVSLTDGNPTGTLFGTNTNGAFLTSATGWFEVTLTAAAVVTTGSLLAALLVQPSGTGNCTIGRINSTHILTGIPYEVSFTGSWIKNSQPAAMALGYDDGTWEMILPYTGISAVTLTAYNNTSTPDEYGLRFKYPYEVEIDGFWFYGLLAGDCTVKLVTEAYNSGAGTGILSSIALDKDVRQGGGVYNTVRAALAPVTLTADTWYRLIVEPTTATSFTLFNYTLNSAALQAACPGGANFHMTSAKNPTQDSDWTNYNSGTLKNPYMGLRIGGVGIPGSLKFAERDNAA